MLIGNKYKIESDSLNITLYKKRKPTKGDKRLWRAIGHYSSLKEAFKGLVDFGVKETKLKDLKTIIAKQDELYTLIETSSHQ